MCHGHHGGRRGRRRFGDKDEWLRRLEDYRRDLEQELADVSDVIRRLREEPQTETARV